MKRFLSTFVTLLSTAIIAVFLPIICAADAEGLAATKGSCGVNATWAIADGTLTISGAGAVDDYEQDSAPWYGAMGKIEKVVINEGITRLGANVFNNSETIKEVVFPNSLEEIGVSAFYSSKIENPILPPNLKVIEEKAFAWCWEITEITIPDSVTSIGKSAFSCCVMLAKVQLPASLTTCEDQILENTAITTIIVPDGVTTLGKQCFESNSKLTEIYLPATVTTIGDKAFDRCNKLADVHFAGTEAQALSINIGKTNACLTSATWHCNDNDGADLSSLSGVCGVDATWAIVDGTLTISGTGAVDDYEQDAAPWYGAMGKIEKVVINEGITRLGANVFNNSETIKEVVFPNSLEEIGVSAFYSSKIENPILPPNLKVIEEKAFAWCWEITEITIPDSVTSIGKSAFSCCVMLAKVQLPASLTTCEDQILENTAITTIIVPDGVTTLGKQCFESNSKLTEIYLPATVTTIGDKAFDRCNKLADVHFAGTEAQALSINIGKTNACLTSATWHFMSAYSEITEPQYEPLEIGDSGSAVLAMKERLRELGYYGANAEFSDRYNDAHVERVKMFQKRNGLPQTGKADIETLIRLYSDEAIANK